MEDIYSNFDHEFVDGAINFLKENPGKELCHTAWDFCSYVRFEDNKFKARVMQYHAVAAELENETAEDLIKETIEKFGDS